MNYKTLTQITIIKAVIAALLLLTYAQSLFGAVEIDFDQFLRFISFVGFVLIGYKYWKAESKIDAIIAALCALIFNPFQHLDMFSRYSWRSFNVWFGLFVAVWAVADYLKSRKLKTATNQ